MRFAPPRFDVRHLEAFCAVAEEGTFRGAADVLGYSQAAISQQVAGLEAAVGAPVFDRPGGPKPVRLTPAGRLLLPHAQRVLARLDEAREDLDQLLSGTGGRLAIGAFQSVSVELLPHIVRRVLSETPTLQVRAVEADDNDVLLEQLRMGEIDLAFLAGTHGYALNANELDTRLLGTDPYVAVLPPDGVLDGATEMPMRALATHGLIGGLAGGTQTFIEDHIRASGITPRYVFRSNDNGAMQGMVRGGMGIAIMPRLAVDLTDTAVRILPVSPTIPARSLLLATPRDPMLTEAARHFADVAADVCRERLDQPGNGVSP